MPSLQALVVVLQCYYIAIQYPTQALIITLNPTFSFEQNDVCSNHKFCKDCFVLKNNITIKENDQYKFICPSCDYQFANKYDSIDEAILVGEATTIINYLDTLIQLGIYVDDVNKCINTYKSIISKLESNLQSNKINFETLYTLFETA